MTAQDTPDQRLAKRRAFLLAARRHGCTAAVLGLAGGYLFDGQAMAQTAADEERKQKAAKLTMLFATEYKIEDYVKYPIMQAKYKDNIEAQSKGAIYTKLHPAGQLGIGAALAQKIQAGTVQGWAVSLSNFSPYTPVVDLINIPYWCGDNQRFANLVTSKAWNDEITPKVMAKGYKPLFYFTVDPRTIASRKGFKLIKTPSGMQGMKMRVPPSKLLQTFYRLAGANPTVVPWGETATAIKQTQIETFAQIEKARTESMRILREGGCQFYNPSDAEMKQWVDSCGEARKEYDEFKLQFAGSLAAFDNFKKAASTKGPITVADFRL